MEVICELRNLKTVLQERKENCFVPEGAKLLWQKLKNFGYINFKTFIEEAEGFFLGCMSYILLREEIYLGQRWKSTEIINAEY
jgi:hypothetical protein